MVVGPAWTRGEIERPAGERNMGTWTAAVYTEEQQRRLGVTESGEPAATSMAVPFKEDIPPAGLGVACGFNSFFVCMSLLDYSADLFVAADPPARLAFLATYLQWKEWMPVLTPMLAVLLLLIPFMLIGMLRDAAQSCFGWRRAPALRHAADVVQPLALVTVLSVSIGLLAPAQAEVVATCALNQKGLPAGCEASAAALRPLHAVVLALNLLLFACE